jgi:hypothetical protein
MEHRLTYIKIGGPTANAELKALFDMTRKQGGPESQGGGGGLVNLISSNRSGAIQHVSVYSTTILGRAARN